MASDDLDGMALTKSFKAFCIIFLILIASANISLLVRLFRGASAQQIFHSPRRFMITTLACGDIFLAVFSMTIYVRSFFEKSFEPDCDTAVTAQTYMEYYFPFVYIASFCCLCVELINRRWVRGLFGFPFFATLIFCAFPWMLGLLPILPLRMAGIDLHDCMFKNVSFTLSRGRALIIFSIIIPVIPAAVCLASVMIDDTQNLPDVDLSLGKKQNHPHSPASLQMTRMSPAYSPPGHSSSAQPPQLETGVDNPNFPSPDNQEPSLPEERPSMETHPVPSPTSYYNNGQSDESENPQLEAPYLNKTESHPPKLGTPVPYSSKPDIVTTAASIALEKSLLVRVFACYIIFMFPYTLYILITIYGDNNVNYSKDVYNLILLDGNDNLLFPHYFFALGRLRPDKPPAPAAYTGVLVALFWFRLLRAFVWPIVWKTKTPDA